jgi:hypothetical protein
MSTPFQPLQRDSVPLSVTASTQRIRIRPDAEANFTNSVRIIVIGTDAIRIQFGDSGVTAAVATGIPMIGNSVETFTVPAGATHLAAIAGGTASALTSTLGGGA